MLVAMDDGVWRFSPNPIIQDSWMIDRLRLPIIHPLSLSLHKDTETKKHGFVSNNEQAAIKSGKRRHRRGKHGPMPGPVLVESHGPMPGSVPVESHGGSASIPQSCFVARFETASVESQSSNSPMPRKVPKPFRDTDAAAASSSSCGAACPGPEESSCNDPLNMVFTDSWDQQLLDEQWDIINTAWIEGVEDDYWDAWLEDERLALHLAMAAAPMQAQHGQPSAKAEAKAKANAKSKASAGALIFSSC